MIKVILGECPASLQVPNDQTNRAAQTTHQRRKEVIELHKSGKAFPKTDDNYTSRYKQKDTREALETAFHKKCAYCEIREQRMDVEHYRPTSTYPWLAYSWDNLLLACQICNQDYKKQTFDVKSKRAVYTEDFLEKVHLMTAEYAKSEEPYLLNPTLDSPEELFEFGRDGSIKGKEERSKYSAKICGLNRNSLKDERKTLLDSFENNLNALCLLLDNNKQAIQLALHPFSDDAKNPEKEFTSFRKFALKFLLQEIIDQACNTHVKDE